MDEEAGFVAALVAEPSDRTAALVFADWLDERGDPRGPMLRNDEVRAWMAPTYANPLPGLAKALETGKKVTQASKVLAVIGEAAVPTVVALLAHEKALVRFRAVKALRLIGPKAKDAVPALLALVKGTNKDDADARREAVRLLGVLKAKSAAKDELAKELDNADPAARLAAVEAISKLRTKTAGSALCKALGDSSPEVRRAAVDQLRWIAGPSMPFAVEPLRKALADDSTAVQASSAAALGRIGPKARAAVPDVIRLISALRGMPNMSAVGTIEALAEIGAGDSDALEALLALLRDPDVRSAASAALLKWPALPEAAAPALLELVRRPIGGNVYADRNLVHNGLQALARITSYPPEVQEELRAHLDTEHASTVASALAEVGAPAAVFIPHLAQAFTSTGKQRAPYEIARALATLGGDGITVLVQALDREQVKGDAVPAAAADGLKLAGPAALPALPALRARLRKKGAFGQAYVISAIAAIGPPAAEAVPELVELALDRELENYLASTLFGALETFAPAVLPFALRFVAALQDPNQWAIHARTIELLSALVPHGFDALAVFHATLRQALSPDFYAGQTYLVDQRRREIAGAAIVGLTALGPAAEVALTDLRTVAEKVPDWNGHALREKALTAYGAIGAPAVPDIIAALADPMRDIRLAAIKALVASGDSSSESQEALRKLETDQVRIVRAQATSALKKIMTRKPRTVGRPPAKPKPE